MEILWVWLFRFGRIVLTAGSAAVCVMLLEYVVADSSRAFYTFVSVLGAGFGLRIGSWINSKIDKKYGFGFGWWIGQFDKD